MSMAFRTASPLLLLSAFLAGVGWPGGLARAAQVEVVPEVRIEEIEILGVSVLPVPTVEAAVEISPGEKLERRKIVRTAESLQALYRLRGYEKVSIRSELSRRRGKGGEKTQNVLVIRIAEGEPTRIGGVRIVPDGALSEEARKYWNEISPGLAEKVGLLTGDILDQEKLAVAKRNLQDVLAGKDFVGAHAEDPIIENGAPVVDGRNLSAGRWVAIELHVRLGDRVSFGFRGNTVLPQSRLMALVEEQRLLGFGKDFIGAIRGRIEEEYRSLGFSDARVEAYSFERPTRQERHVTYAIVEGPRFRLAGVDFDGNRAFSSKELRREFLARSSPLIQSGYYIEKDLQKAAELLIEWMKSRGFLSAKLVTISSARSPRPSPFDGSLPVRATIYLYESDQTILHSVTVKGNEGLTVGEIKGLLGLREGGPLNLFAFSEGMEMLKARYRAKGYLEAKVTNEDTDQVVHYTSENRQADIVLEIAEGPRFRTGRVTIEGLVFTREAVLRRELQLREGEVLDEQKVTESETRLRRLGIFSVVTLRLTDSPDEPGVKNVRVLVQEAIPGVVSGGLGFRNDLGIRAFGEISYSNLRGKNHTVALDATGNRRIDDTYRFGEYEVQLVYMWPWFLGLDAVNFRPALTATQKQFDAFDVRTQSASATWEKQLLAYPPLTGLFTYSLERVEQFHATRFLQDNAKQTIGAITPTLRLDLRDNPLAPTSGFFATSSFEYGAPWLGSSGEGYPLGYTRFQFRADQFVSLHRSVLIYLSFRTGIARSTERPTLDPRTGLENPASGGIPLIKQFALGGAGSLRGFVEQELNDQTLLIRGIASYVNYRMQLDLPFSGALRFGPFLDAANLQHDTYSLGNLRYGAGFGFHYLTPVGPVNLDLGFKLDRQPQDKVGSAIYFSIGVL
ncbi:MAG: BamA/TamA family outer membrane protein [Oligoflexia bacterium]|nr:BamA/TamA family outer membrane protein [Oligoflexia bacterium]